MLSHRKKLLILLLVPGLVFTLLWFLCPFDFQRLERFPASTRVLDRDGRILRVYASSLGEMRFPVELEEISPWLCRATVAVEDRHFDSHFGIDPMATARALWQNISRLEVHSGASTITMQLVRLVVPRPRTLPTKAIEAFHSLQIEARLTKDEILSSYLNLAPYGGNLRGVEAASLCYFGKRAVELSLAEAALLAGLPQSPSRLRPDRHYERTLERRRVVLDAMLREGMIDHDQHEAALATRPSVRLHRWPFQAPHFADLARKEANSAPRVPTTLDPAMLAVAEKHLDAFFHPRFKERRDLSGAVVVLEVESGAVRALLGSPGFFDRARQGQVNTAFARRSTGSTLKPFLYALAFDRGVAAPSTYLPDVPTPFATYDPENFDRLFHGPVSAADALGLSLNVPAVRLLEKLGTEELLVILRRLGLGTFELPAAHYGLALALGGGEARLLELANAYRTLPRLGVFQQYRVLENGPIGEPLRVFHPAACRLVLDALSGEDHLERVTGRRPLPGEARLGYKTGTSFGLRDAWAFAFSTELVVGVWLGDPRGRPRPELVGVETAAPIAVAILRDLSGESGSTWPGGETVAKRVICAASGYPAGSSCPATALGLFARRAPVPLRCEVHRVGMVDEERGVEVCRSCRRGRTVTSRVVEEWPADVAQWLRERRGVEARWPHEASCSKPVLLGQRPRILSPAPGAEYRLLRRSSFPQRLHFKAAAAADARHLYWFVGGELVAAGPVSRSVAWPLRPGVHEIRCVDDRGRAARGTVRVRER